MCVLSDLTLLPLLGGERKSWYIIIIINYIGYSLMYISDYIMDRWLKTGNKLKRDNSDTVGEGVQQG